MPLKIFELLSILLSAMVAAMFLGPWAALSRSMRSFSPELLIAVVQRMSRNMAQVMTILIPASILSIVPVLALLYGKQTSHFYLNLAALALFVVALIVTMVVEVPIVKQIEIWTPSTLPANWQQLRDRWGSFHLIRILAALAGLTLLLLAALF